MVPWPLLGVFWELLIFTVLLSTCQGVLGGLKGVAVQLLLGGC